MNPTLKLLGLSALAALTASAPRSARAQTPASPALTLTGGGTPLTVLGGALTVVGDARIDASTTLDNAGALSISGTLAAPAGTVRLSGPGAHQFQSPSSAISEGTRSARTTVASSSTPTACPTAICFMKNTELTPKARKTTAIMTAAAVITRYVRRR